MRDLCDQYQSIQQALKLPQMKLCGLECSDMRHYDDRGELQSIIKDFAPIAGWLCYQSKAVLVGESNPYEPNNASGNLLSAELLNKDNVSLHIRQNHQGGWQTISYKDNPDDKQYLSDTVEFIMHDAELLKKDEIRKMRYQRYWKKDQQLGTHNFVARFIGFSEQIGLKK